MNKMSIDSATQLNRILSFLPEGIKAKIPKDIWKKINEKTDNNFCTKINEVRDIKEENILPETRRYLSFIFINYLATEEEKEEYTQIIKSNEEKYQKAIRKKYNPDNIFNKKKKIEEENKAIIPYKKNIFQKIWEKIKKEK